MRVNLKVPLSRGLPGVGVVTSLRTQRPCGPYSDIPTSNTLLSRSIPHTVLSLSMPLLSLSPSVPLAHYDTFRIQLGIAHPAFGHALWETSSGEYPPVQVGDVGFTRQGQFHRLLNVLYSENHPCNQRFGVPVDHERLPPVPNDIARGTLYRARLCSYGVTATSGGSNIQAEE